MRFLIPCVAAMAVAATPAAPPRSVYTTLDPDRCTTVSADDEAGGSTQRCPGTAGYTLLVHEGDLRQTVDVVAPGGAVYPLDFGSHVTSAFSSVGPRAEWRVDGRQPVALIVRLSANEDVDDPLRLTHYLAVAQVSARGACLVARVEASSDMNARARRIADRAARMPCLTRP